MQVDGLAREQCVNMPMGPCHGLVFIPTSGSLFLGQYLDSP